MFLYKKSDTYILSVFVILTLFRIYIFFICRLCLAMFARKSFLAPETSTWEKCKIKFPTKGLLTKHERQIHLKVQFSCQDCDKIFLSKAAMASHIKIIHLQILDYKCGKCKRQFGFLPSFKRHLKTFGHKSE